MQIGPLKELGERQDGAGVRDKYSSSAHQLCLAMELLPGAPLCLVA